MTADIETLGKYQLLEELGRGGFATVYRALNTTLDREEALKVLHPQLLVDPGFVARFLREARAIANLRHPHIVTVYEVGNADGRLFISMELALGSDLGRAIAERARIPWAEALELLRPVCEALDYAHAQKVVHRDLKPSNILLDPARGPLLSDFGFARLMGGSSQSLSLSGGILGTPAYIAPEVWELDAATPAADIYALGCIAFEMLTGQVLFTGATPIQAMRAHDRGPVLPLAWPEGVPVGVAEVLGKALAREPGARCSSATALWHALNDLEARAQAEREAAERTAVAGQWRAEAESALAAGELSAARMAAGRWMAAAPEDGEAKAFVERVREAVGAGPREARNDAEVAEGDGPRAGLETGPEQARLGPREARKDAEEPGPRKARNDAEVTEGGSAAERERQETEEEPRREAEMASGAQRADGKARREAEKQVRREAERAAAVQKSGEKARLQAEEKAGREAEKQARLEAEEARRLKAPQEAPDDEKPAAKRRRLPVWVWAAAGLVIVAAIALVLVLQKAPQAGSGASAGQAGAAARQTPTRAAAAKPPATADPSGSTKSGEATLTAAVFANRRATSTAQVLTNQRATSTAQVLANQRATSTAQVLANQRATSTAQVLANQRATSTAQALATQRVTATAKAAGATATAAAAGARLAAGPTSGSLQHQEDGYIETYDPGLDLTNFVAEARFYNPYPLTEGTWDFGFLFRARYLDGQWQHHAVRVRSSGQWCHVLKLEGSWGDAVCGPVAELYTGADASNLLRLVVIDKKGLFWVNDRFVASLDLSGLTMSGGVQAATGIASGDEINGKTTRYEGFSVRSLDAAPVGGPTPAAGAASKATPAAGTWYWKGRGPFSPSNGAVGIVNYTDRVLTVTIDQTGKTYEVPKWKEQTLAVELAPGTYTLRARVADLPELLLIGWDSKRGGSINCDGFESLVVQKGRALVIALWVAPYSGVDQLQPASCPWYEKDNP